MLVKNQSHCKKGIFKKFHKIHRKTPASDSIFKKTYLGRGVFLQIQQNFEEHLFVETSGGYFCLFLAYPNYFVHLYIKFYVKNVSQRRKQDLFRQNSSKERVSLCEPKKEMSIMIQNHQFLIGTVGTDKSSSLMRQEQLK